MTKDHKPRAHEVEPYALMTYPPDDNFDNFVQNWKREKPRLTIFLGAGASVGARNKAGVFVPTAYELRNELWLKFMCTDLSVGAFDPLILKGMGLEHCAALCEARSGRRAVVNQVVDTFTCPRPLWQHAVLPFVRPEAVFTVNFDELVEKGWAIQESEAGTKPLWLRYHSRAESPAAHVPLFKPHGTLQHASRPVGDGGLVVSMFDYFKMIGHYRDMIGEFLSSFNETCVLFIGYAFGDMDICSELFRLRQNRDVPWYAVFPRDDADVRRMYQDKFGILQINRRFVDFMAELDERLNFIPDNWKFDKLKRHRAKLIQ